MIILEWQGVIVETVRLNCPGASYCIADLKHPDEVMCDCIPPIFKKHSNKKEEKDPS